MNQTIAPLANAFPADQKAGAAEASQTPTQAPLTDFGPLTRKYWDELVANAPDPELAKLVEATLKHHYNQRAGGYHDLSHLESVFEHLDRMFSDPVRFHEFDGTLDQELADRARSEEGRNKIINDAQKRADNRLTAIATTFWHDIIYDIQTDESVNPDTNEGRSAKVSRQDLYRLGIKDDIRASVATWINSSKSHMCNAQTNPAQAYFLDADMAVLGSAPNDYATYLRKNRRDYDRYSEEAYTTGRYQFLLKMEKRSRNGGIFLSQQFKDDYEAQARKNIDAEMCSHETVIQAKDSSFRRKLLL